MNYYRFIGKNWKKKERYTPKQGGRSLAGAGQKKQKKQRTRNEFRVSTARGGGSSLSLGGVGWTLLLRPVFVYSGPRAFVLPSLFPGNTQLAPGPS